VKADAATRPGPGGVDDELTVVDDQQRDEISS